MKCHEESSVGIGKENARWINRIERKNERCKFKDKRERYVCVEKRRKELDLVRVPTIDVDGFREEDEMSSGGNVLASSSCPGRRRHRLVRIARCPTSSGLESTSL